jgi:hypothetical protein
MKVNASESDVSSTTSDIRIAILSSIPAEVSGRMKTQSWV